MAASTGPAHGTKTRPRLRPSTNPPPSVTSRPAVSRAKGRSSRSPTARHQEAEPEHAEAPDPDPPEQVLRAGRARSAATSRPGWPTEKLRTRPATTAKGRRRRRSAASRARAGGPGVRRSLLPRLIRGLRPPTGSASGAGRHRHRRSTGHRGGSRRDRAVGSTPSSSRPLAAPEAKITGSTGRMHGEMPVTRPPRNPTTTQEDHAVSLPRRSGGAVSVDSRRERSWPGPPVFVHQ